MSRGQIDADEIYKFSTEDQGVWAKLTNFFSGSKNQQQVFCYIWFN